MNRIRTCAVLLLLCLLQFCLLAGCAPAEKKEGEAGSAQLMPEDFGRAKIGVITGSAHDGTVGRLFPEAERVYFNAIADMVLAVEQKKIDCYVEDAPFLTAVLWSGADVKRLETPIGQMHNGFVFPQTEESRPLREQLNAFLAESEADGTLDRLLQKWLGDSPPTEHPDYSGLTGENGTIRLAVCVDGKPLVYKYQDQCTGFEIELLTLFGQKHGYAFEIEEVPFVSILAGIGAGKYDMASSAFNITAEREESVDFSEPYACFDVVLVTRADAGSTSAQGRSLAEFEHARLGIMTGSVFDAIAKERFPDATREYYSLFPDMILAVEQGKLDAYISELPYVAAAVWEGAGIEALDEVLAQTRAGYLFRKDEASAELRGQMNEYVLRARESGLLDALQDKWFGAAEPTEALDYSSLSGENGILRVAVAPDLKPISYVKDGQLTGYELELLLGFAKEYGYGLDMSMMTFDAILPGVVGGKYDIGTGAVTITEERALSVDFSESHLGVDVVMVVKAEQSGTQRSFREELKEDFEKTFIREDRWKLIVRGMGITLLISISAAAAGSLLGFGLYMLSRSERKALRKLAGGIAKVYSRIVAGTPVVVILMILFYVIFGKLRDISGVLVAVICFSLTFGAFVFDHLTVSVNSVDRGQTEAAYALGYPRNRTFFRIIFPQAMTVFLPSYCGQAVELIKATAVVGYIAVNDLTKMGDIIRSNTYEAFFPLIATAVIYFLLTWLLSVLLRFVKLHFEPKRRSREQILKGVKTV